MGDDTALKPAMVDALEGLQPTLAQCQLRRREAEQEVARAEARLADAAEDQGRVERAIAILKGQEPGKKRRLRGRGSKVGGNGDWMPGEELRRAVESFVAEHPDGVTVTDLNEALEHSKTGIDRTLRYLREDHGPDQPARVRLAGKRGTAMLYKPVQELVVPRG